MAEEEKNDLEFPYLNKVHVVDCYAFQRFEIEISSVENSWRHLVLTGKNGSGKTTILRSINEDIVCSQRYGGSPLLWDRIQDIDRELISKSRLYFSSDENYFRIRYDGYRADERASDKWRYIYAFFPAFRKVTLKAVKTAENEGYSYESLEKDPEEFAKGFKQFLVNKRVRQAFYQIEKNEKEVEATEKFFNQFEGFLKRIYADSDLRFVFANEEFEFYIQLSSGQRFTLDQMSDGYSAFLWILMDLVARTDIIRKLQKNLDYDPPGIVLIDEPELHLHLELQYEVLPMLTQFFPNVQFIVATHSPAVISSIENATVFDLTTQSVAPNYTPGSSFSELMMSHFGLDNEFGPVADKLLEDAKSIIDSAKEDPSAPERLSNLLDQNADILTPTLKVKLEAAIRRMKTS